MAQTQIVVPRSKIALSASEFTTNVGTPQAVAYSYGAVDQAANIQNQFDVTDNSASFNQFTLAGGGDAPLFVCALTDDEFGVLDGIIQKRFSPASGTDLTGGIILGEVSIASLQEELLWTSAANKVAGATQTLRGGQTFENHDWIVIYYSNTANQDKSLWTRRPIQAAPFIAGNFNDLTITALSETTFVYTTGSDSLLTDSSQVEIWGV